MDPARPLVPPLEPIRPHMEQVVDLLHDTAAKVENPLRAMLHRRLNGGKLLRPAVVVLVGGLFASPMSPFWHLAAAVEMLHAATLIHDDLVDGASLRRGGEALHTIWPVGATVLAGDHLLGQATLLVAGLGQTRIVEVFAAALCTMCAGEIHQLLVASGDRPRREDYIGGIEAKTASLFAASADMAGILAGATESQIAALRRYGRELGMAFQMIDDVLDFTADEGQLGKPPGSDLRQGLITLPTLYYLQGPGDPGPVKAVLSGERDEAHVRVAIDAVCASEAIEESLADARAHARRSQEALASLPDNESRQTLHSLAGYAVSRAH